MWCVLSQLLHAVNVGIGIDKASYDVVPGMREYTYSYSSNNGYRYSGSLSSGRQYGPKFGKGDTIGVIFNRAYSTISFTKNGEHLGVAVREKVREWAGCGTVACQLLHESQHLDW